jgi:ferredoxin
VTASVTIENDFCMGSGLCARHCPEVFGLDDDGYVELRNPHPPAELLPAVLTAEADCPASAISVDQ